MSDGIGSIGAPRDQLSDALRQPLWTALPDGSVDYANPFWLAYTGIDDDASLGEGWSAAVHPDDIPAIWARWEAAVERGAPYEVEYRLRRADGVYRWHVARVVPMTDANGDIVRWAGTAIDIHERREAEDALRARKHQAELAASVGVALSSARPLPAQLQCCAEALVAHAGAAFARIWTVDPDDQESLVMRASAGLDTCLDGAYCRVSLGAGEIGRIASERRPHLTNSVLDDPEMWDLARTRRERMVAFAGHPLLVGDRLVGVLGLFAKRPLTESEFATIGTTADMIAVGVDRAAAAEMREALLEREHAAREWAEAAASTLETVNRVGRILAAELDLDRLVQAVTDAATELTGARFGALFYKVVDGRGESYTLYTLSGVDPAAFTAFPMPGNTAVFGPTFRGEGVVRISDVTQDPRFGHNSPYYGLPPGHLPVVSYLAAPVISRTGEVLGGLFFGHDLPGVFDDRSEEIAVGLAAHAAIAIDNARLYRDANAAEARYRGLFEGVADAILVADDGRRYVDANAAAVALLGYTKEEFLGLRVDDVVAAGPEWGAAEFDLFRAERRWQGELELRRKDGTTVPVEARATVLTMPDGTVNISVVRDVSHRRAAEREQREFLEAVSHDLKTPLAVVQGQAQLMERRLQRDVMPDTANLARSAATISIAARRMDAQLGELQDAMRLRAGHPLELRTGRIDLVALAEAAVAEAQPATGYHRLEIAGQTALVGCWDGPRLRRVLDNLLGNAVKYSPRGGTITVEIAEERRDGQAWAVLAVRDEGVGIPAADLPHVFERYRRGSNVGARISGSGIGLAGARQIVEQHGGTITASSMEGRGSLITVSLPLDRGAAPSG